MRAGPWGVTEYLRRLLATALAGGAIALPILVGLSDEHSHLACPLTIVSLIAVWFFLTLPSRQTREISIVGRSLRVARRGRFTWYRSSVEVPVHEEGHVIRLCGGYASPRGLRHPELGLELLEGRFGDKKLRLVAPRFAIEGLDRRSEVRLLAEHLARRLGLRIRVERDDVWMLTILLSHHGEEPPRERVSADGYRGVLKERSLALTAGPGFEASASVPALLQADVAQLYEVVRLERGAVLVGQRPTLRRWSWSWGWVKKAAGVLVVAGGVGAIVGLLFDATFEAALVGFLSGVLFVPLAILQIGATLLVAQAMAAPLAGVVKLLVLVLAGGRHRPGGLGALQARHWTLREGVLEAKGLWRRYRSVEGAAPREVLLLELTRTRSRRSTARWQELWIRSDRWIYLARTPEAREWSKPTAVPTRALEALGYEVARALDVPLRGVCCSA